MLIYAFSTGDSIECNASTFTLEMKETAYILGSLSDDSNALVVIDEACSNHQVLQSSATN